MKTDDAHYMSIAIELAKKGQGRTSPNPCVGAVIVKDGVVVGKGYHHMAGTPHAEVHAIADAGSACHGATIYVTLEPCNHTGKTPPCSKAVVAAGLQRVVIGMKDPHALASGGSAYLRYQGIEVDTGILEQECRQLNYPFLKHSVSGLPWVVMKAGISLDGRISYMRGHGGAITGSEAKQRVHQLRNQLDAILIGVGTALIDDPSLTTRLPENGRDPLRIILDSHLRLPPDARMLQQKSKAQTWIYCSPQASEKRCLALERAGAIVHTVTCDEQGHLNIDEIINHLGHENINSVLVEGGGQVHGSFVKKNKVDQVYLFMAPFFIGDRGMPLVEGYSLEAAQRDGCLRLEKIETELLGQDICIHGLVQGKS